MRESRKWLFSGRMRTLAALMAITVVVGGCGGDSRRASEPIIGQAGTTELAAGSSPEAVVSSSVSSPVTDASRRAYISRLDGVCGRLDRERNRQRENASGDLAQIAGRYEASIAIGAQELRDVESIPPPSGDARALRVNVFDVITRELAVRKRIHAALLAGNVTALAAEQRRLDDLTRWLAAFALGYGFKVCGTD